MEDDVLSSIRETNDHVREARALSPVSEPEDDYLQAETKMKRALDRLRRAAVKTIDSPDDVKSPDPGIFSAVRALLMDIATTLETLLRTVSTSDMATATPSISLFSATFRDLFQMTTPPCLTCYLC
jgi:hypothetical protein